MNSKTDQPISMPMPRRLRRAAKNFLPIVFFLLISGLCSLLWQYQNQSVILPGEVEVVEHVITSPRSGLMLRFVPNEGQTFSIYAPVAEGQLLVQLDDRDLLDNANQIQLEINQLSELTAAKVATTSTTVNNLQQSAVVRTQLAHSVVSIKTQTLTGESSGSPKNGTADSTDENSSQQAAKEDDLQAYDARAWQQLASSLTNSLQQLSIVQKSIELRKLDHQIRQLSLAPSFEATTSPSLEELKLARTRDQNDIEKIKTELAFAWLKGDDGSEDLDVLKFSSVDNGLRWQAALRRSQFVVSQLTSLTEAVESLDIYSPVEGQIESTAAEPPRSVLAGESLMTIVPNRGATVVVYAHENGDLRPYVGMPVTMRSRTDPTQQSDAFVESVGPRLESIPARHRDGLLRNGWGRPMRIRIPDRWIIEPGSLVDVIFRRQHGSL